MKKFLILLLTVFVLMTNVGCVSAAKKRNAAIAQGVYKVNQSLKAGRIDLAKKYSDQLIRVVPPPKKVEEVKPIEVVKPDGSKNKYVVLPPEFDGTPALAIGGKDFTKLTTDFPTIAKQLDKEEKEVKKFEATVDDSIRTTIKESEKEKKSWFGTIFATLGIGGIVGVIALCCVFPAAIPVVISVFQGVISGVNSAIRFIGGLLKKKDPPDG